jgi:hypothetical protein
MQIPHKHDEQLYAKFFPHVKHLYEFFHTLKIILYFYNFLGQFDIFLVSVITIFYQSFECVPTGSPNVSSNSICKK